MKIQFISKLAEFEINNEKLYKNWIKYVILSENRKLGEIVYTFVDQEAIIGVNKTYLLHNFSTDVITFNSSFLNTISGNIIICIRVVKENAYKYSNGIFINEFNRVVIHGILHLVGYNDTTSEETVIMRGKEDYYLELFAKPEA